MVDLLRLPRRFGVVLAALNILIGVVLAAFYFHPSVAFIPAVTATIAYIPANWYQFLGVVILRLSVMFKTSSLLTEVRLHTG